MSVQDIQKLFEESAFGKAVLIPRFFEHATINQNKSKQYGINIYETHTFVEIKTKGRKDTTSREATDDDKALFDKSYQKYLQSISTEHIPMETLLGYSKANEFILRDLGITTVEQLADCGANLPLASLKLMKDCAINLIKFMSEYEPPVFVNDKPRRVESEERQNRSGQDTNRRGGSLLRDGEGIPFADGQAGDNESGVRQYGVSLDEDGNVIGTGNSRTCDIAAEIAKSRPQEKRVISFY